MDKAFGSEARITLEDSPLSAIMKLAEGNPGAIIVMTEIIKHGEQVDPDAILGSMAHILSLDTRKIYGSRIWMLYKDVCKENLVHMLAVLRAVQLGELSEEDLNNAIDNYGKGIDINDIMAIVQARIPAFGKNDCIKMENVKQ